MLIPLPAMLADRAANPVGDPAQVRDAATVVLLRNGARGLETYLLRRQQSMKFAPGMYVFPGGGVDPDDQRIDWVGAPAAEWALRFGCAEPVARRLVCAAARETFEESGILLAGPDAHSVVADTSGDDWVADRIALENREFSFAAFLERRKLVLRADLLAAWAHWITPKFEPRRFDTRFFVAVVPGGQRVGEIPGEADEGVWMSLRAILDGVKDSSIAMLPPTFKTIEDLVALTDAGEALTVAPQRRILPIEPELVLVDGKPFLRAELGE